MQAVGYPSPTAVSSASLPRNQTGQLLRRRNGQFQLSHQCCLNQRCKLRQLHAKILGIEASCGTHSAQAQSHSQAKKQTGLHCEVESHLRGFVWGERTSCNHITLIFAASEHHVVLASIRASIAIAVLAQPHPICYEASMRWADFHRRSGQSRRIHGFSSNTKYSPQT